MAMLRNFHGVLIGDYLLSDCASSAFLAFPLRFYGAPIALSRRSHTLKS
jgi:hypothetical protein